jgi:hypothetical protein
MGIDRNMGIVIEIFPETIPVIGLQNVQGAPVTELRSKSLQKYLKVLERKVFKQVAGECKINRIFFEKSNICNVADNGLNPVIDILWKFTPRIYGISFPGFHIINEIPIATAEVQYGIVVPYETGKVEPPQAFPQDVTFGIK